MEPQKAGGYEEICPHSGVAQKDRGGAGAAETTTGRARGTIAEMNAQSLMEDKKLGHIKRSDVYGRFHRVATNGATPASLTTDDWQIWPIPSTRNFPD